MKIPLAFPVAILVVLALLLCVWVARDRGALTPLEPGPISAAEPVDPGNAPSLAPVTLADPSTVSTPRKASTDDTRSDRRLAVRRAVRLTGRALDEDRAGTPSVRGDDGLWLEVLVRRISAETNKEETLLATSRPVHLDREGRFAVSPGFEHRGPLWTFVDDCKEHHAKTYGDLGPDAHFVVFLRRGARAPTTRAPFTGGGLRVDHIDELDLETDLGDIAVEPWPLLVAGRVFDLDFQPVPNARIVVEEYRGSRGCESWKPLDSSAVSDESGWFSVSGAELPVDMRLRVSATGFEDERVFSVVPGSRHVQVELHPHGFGALHGSMLLDADVATSDIEACLRAPDDRITPGGSSVDGTFAFEHVESGNYELEVRTRGTRFTLARVEDVYVFAGTPTEDPRVEGIDVRGRLTKLEARLVTPDGEAFGARRVRVEDEEGAGGVLETGGDGHLFALAPRGTQQLFALAPGYPRSAFMHNETIVLRSR